jgi:hypothetical protein
MLELVNILDIERELQDIDEYNEVCTYKDKISYKIDNLL